MSAHTPQRFDVMRDDLRCHFDGDYVRWSDVERAVHRYESTQILIAGVIRYIGLACALVSFGFGLSGHPRSSIALACLSIGWGLRQIVERVEGKG